LGADLSFSRLQEANLQGALLYDVNLYKAQLVKADLRRAKGLEARQLAAAWFDEQTKLPDELASLPWVKARIKACTEAYELSKKSQAAGEKSPRWPEVPDPTPEPSSQ
jgi:hypothetical protein